MRSDITIAGAGMIGLATAYQLIRKNLRVLVLEKESAPALHQSGRNSGVVHTGVYYKPGSLKAKNCIEGRKELLSFCEMRGISFQKKYKLIVANRKEEAPRLRELLARGQTNGVPGLKLLSKEEVLEIEPNVNAIEALLVPECHIIEYKRVAEALCDWIKEQGSSIEFNEPLIEVKSDGLTCITQGKNRAYSSSFFINCTGVHSDRVTRSSLGNATHQILPFRGEYYSLSPEKKEMVRGLIYPVPDPKFPFLGVHLTPQINGPIEAGPNAVLAWAREGYKKTDFSWKDTKETLMYSGFWKMAFRYWKAGAYEMARSLSKELFLRDLQRLVPSIEARDLHPGGSGIRAQVVTREGKLLDDFAFQREGRMLHVLNAPSPAATASFSIGQTLAEMILK